MEIKKYKNEMDSYDFELIEGNKTLRISFGGTLDLYMSLGDGRKFDDTKNVSVSFDITKGDYEIYSLFDNLYNDVITGNIYGDNKRKLSDDDYLLMEAYNLLVDNDKNINWISDNSEPEIEDRLRISKKDDDTYTLTFYRNDKPMDFGFKSSTCISVRFRNSGSKYVPFNCIFMRLYNHLQDVDPDYHQIHIEEYQYQKRKK